MISGNMPAASMVFGDLPSVLIGQWGTSARAFLLVYSEPITPNVRDQGGDVVRRCYARKLQDCIGKLSREHFLSEGVIRLLTRDNEALFTSVPWRSDGATVRLDVRALGANVLCAKHNRLLSDIDALAVKVFKTLLQSEVAKTQVVEVDGFALERWMLKVACGMLAAHADWEPSIDLLRVLYRGEHMPAGAGLHVISYKGVRAQAMIDTMPIVDPNGRPVGLQFSAGLVAFVFTFERAPPELVEKRPGQANAHHRPGRIIRRFSSGRSYTVDFGWGEDAIVIRASAQVSQT